MNKIAATVLIAGLASTASAQVSITNTNTAATTYATVLDFEDATGGDQWGWMDGSQWSGIGLDMISAGASNGPGAEIRVLDNDAEVGGWGLGSGLSATGGFGVNMDFGMDLTEFSAQMWDSSGPSSFFGGGARITVELDGVEVASLFLDNPAYGGLGDSWFDITTTGGATFDHVRISGFGMGGPNAYVDNASWNAVPTPASAGLLGLGGLVAMRRRR